MRRILALLLTLSGVALSQPSAGPSILYTFTSPSGNACVGGTSPSYVYVVNGTLFSCVAASAGAAGSYGSSSGFSSPLPPANGGTGSTVAFTTGSVVFVGASGVYQQDNANFNIIDSSPYKLKIGAGGNLSLFLANDATKTGIQFYNSGVGGIGIRSDGADIAISTAGSSFSPNTWGSDLVTFKQGGNVGIGNTTASQMLTVGASEQFKVTSAGAVTAAQETITGSSAVNLALTNTTSSLTYTLYSANSASNGFNGFGIFDGTSYRLKIDGSTGNLTVANVLTSYNGITLAGLGQPIIVAVADATAQAANIGTTPLYTVPASGAGMYRLSCYVVLTRAATTSSTLPGCYVVYTDKDSSVSNGNAQATVTSTGNTVGTTAGSNGTGLGQIVMNAAASSTINYVVTGYTSVGATTMQYAVHIKLEYVGP